MDNSVRPRSNMPPAVHVSEYIWCVLPNETLFESGHAEHRRSVGIEWRAMVEVTMRETCDEYNERSGAPRM